MKSSHFKEAIIIIFIVALIFPVIASDKVGGAISPNENRYLSKFPELLEKELSIAEKMSGFEAWIKDNIWGREFATLFLGRISFCFFGIVPEPEIVLGRQNWLFWMPNYDLPNITNTNLPSSEKIDWLRGRLADLTSIIKAEGVDLTIMLWPTKANIYPEYLPHSLEIVSNQNSLQLLDAALSGDKGFDISTAYDELIESKKEAQVYYKAFDKYHWNQRGSFVGYLALMEQAQRHLPELKIYSENDYVITSKIQETKTPWGLKTTEVDEEFNLRIPHPSVSDKTYFEKINFISQDVWLSYNYFINPDGSLPKAILVGDSFLWMFRLQDIADSFSELVFINYLDLQNLPGLVETMNPDLIMIAVQGFGMAEFLANYEYQSKIQ